MRLRHFVVLLLLLQLLLLSKGADLDRESISSIDREGQDFLWEEKDDDQTTEEPQRADTPQRAMGAEPSLAGPTGRGVALKW